MVTNQSYDCMCICSFTKRRTLGTSSRTWFGQERKFVWPYRRDSQIIPEFECIPWTFCGIECSWRHRFHWTVRHARNAPLFALRLTPYRIDGSGLCSILLSDQASFVSFLFLRFYFIYLFYSPYRIHFYTRSPFSKHSPI